MNEAARERSRRRKYGMEPGQYDKMKAHQKGRCAICRKRPKRLLVDHCHKTNTPRSLLCFTCNSLVGQIENKGRMNETVHYLELWNLLIHAYNKG